MKETTKFVTAKGVLKGGRTKAEYIQARAEQGIKAIYSGKEVIEKGEVVRPKGFFLSPIPTGRDASVKRTSN